MIGWVVLTCAAQTLSPVITFEPNDGVFTLTATNDHVRIARDGDGWLAVWSDRRLGTDGVWATRINSVGASKVFVDEGSRPVVGCDDAQCLVAWNRGSAAQQAFTNAGVSRFAPPMPGPGLFALAGRPDQLKGFAPGDQSAASYVYVGGAANGSMPYPSMRPALPVSISAKDDGFIAAWITSARVIETTSAPWPMFMERPEWLVTASSEPCIGFGFADGGSVWLSSDGGVRNGITYENPPSTSTLNGQTVTLHRNGNGRLTVRNVGDSMPVEHDRVNDVLGFAGGEQAGLGVVSTLADGVSGVFVFADGGARFFELGTPLQQRSPSVVASDAGFLLMWEEASRDEVVLPRAARLIGAQGQPMPVSISLSAATQLVKSPPGELWLARRTLGGLSVVRLAEQNGGLSQVSTSQSPPVSLVRDARRSVGSTFVWGQTVATIVTPGSVNMDVPLDTSATRCVGATGTDFIVGTQARGTHTTLNRVSRTGGIAELWSTQGLLSTCASETFVPNEVAVATEVGGEIVIFFVGDAVRHTKLVGQGAPVIAPLLPNRLVVAWAEESRVQAAVITQSATLTTSQTLLVAGQQRSPRGVAVATNHGLVAVAWSALDDDFDSTVRVRTIDFGPVDSDAGIDGGQLDAGEDADGGVDGGENTDGGVDGGTSSDDGPATQVFDPTCGCDGAGVAAGLVSWLGVVAVLRRRRSSKGVTAGE